MENKTYKIKSLSFKDSTGSISGYASLIGGSAGTSGYGLVLSKAAQSGHLADLEERSYNSLTNKPSIPKKLSDLEEKSYNSLTDKLKNYTIYIHYNEVEEYWETETKSNPTSFPKDYIMLNVYSSEDLTAKIKNLSNLVNFLKEYKSTSGEESWVYDFYPASGYTTVDEYGHKGLEPVRENVIGIFVKNSDLAIVTSYPRYNIIRSDSPKWRYLAVRCVENKVGV